MHSRAIKTCSDTWMCSELFQMWTDFLKYKCWLFSSNLQLLQPLLGSAFATSQSGYRGFFLIYNFKKKYIYLEVNICYIPFQFYPDCFIINIHTNQPLAEMRTMHSLGRAYKLSYIAYSWPEDSSNKAGTACNDIPLTLVVSNRQET